MLMDTSTRTILARNVAGLRKQRGWTQGELARRTGTELGQTSVSAIERAVHAATVETIESLASAFRLPAWMLLMPDLDPASATANGMTRVISAYSRLPADGRAQLERVAEAEIRYHTPTLPE